MRKTAAALLLLVLLLLCVGCSRQNQASVHNTQTPRVSAILPHHDDGYWSFIGDGILDAAKNLPLDVKIDTPNLNYNVEQMTELILQQVAAQVDALIVQGIDDPEYIAALETARAQGIGVVLVDTDLSGFQADLYVGTDNLEAGRQMGRRLIEVTGGRANVAILSGDVGYPNLEQRIQGIREAIRNCPDIRILRIEYDKYDAMTVMEKYNDIRKSNPEIDTLVGVEGTSGQTLSQLKESGFRHILVFDANDESISGLKNGLFDGIMCQQNYHMGQVCIQQLNQLFTDGSFSQEKIYTSVDWMAREELEVAAHGE